MIEAKISGIYEIRNKINNHIYVGSSINIKRRWQDHTLKLNKKIHHSAHLQAAWNKYGQDSFEFDILQYCEQANLLQLEQKFLDEWKPEYNISTNTIAPGRGREKAQKEKDSISKRMVGNKYTLGRKRPIEECESISKNNKNKKKTSPNFFLARQKQAKDWGNWLSPVDEIVHIHNLKEFCRKNNLSQGNMQEVFNGKRKQHLGWRIYNGN